MKNNKYSILVVEDSDDDFEFTLRAFKKAGVDNEQIIRCEDGDTALNFLFSKGEYDGNYIFPSIILLDLNLPGVDGLSLLKKIKANKKIKNIPIIILTTSSHQTDIDNCYLNGASSYVQKSVDIDIFYDTIKSVQNYWFDVVLLPQIIH